MDQLVWGLRSHIQEFGLYLEGKGTLWEVADSGGMLCEFGDNSGGTSLGAEPGRAEEKPMGGG